STGPSAGMSNGSAAIERSGRGLVLRRGDSQRFADVRPARSNKAGEARPDAPGLPVRRDRANGRARRPPADPVGTREPRPALHRNRRAPAPRSPPRAAGAAARPPWRTVAPTPSPDRAGRARSPRRPDVGRLPDAAGEDPSGGWAASLQQPSVDPSARPHPP